MIKDKFCKNLTIQEVDDLKLLFMAAFEAQDSEAAMKYYTRSVDKVLLMYDRKRPTAFLFYQIRKIKGANVLHLSLSGKNTEKSGTQKKMGSYLFYKYLLSPISIVQLNVFATVSNNPRSYFNMRAIGESVFPDVIEPQKEFKYHDLYRDVAKELGLAEVDVKGILRFRMQKLGFSIKEDQIRSDDLDKKGRTFMRYIDDDSSHGVLVMTCMRPVVDIPKYYYFQAMKLAKRNSFAFRQKLAILIAQ